MITSLILITLLGGIVSLIIGTLWHSDKTPMGRLHMHVLGFDKLSQDEQKKLIEQAKPHMWKSFLGQFVLSLLTAFFIALVSVTGVYNGLPMGIIALYATLPWVCFIIPVIGSTILWGTIDRAIAWKKFLYDCGHYLVTLIAILLVAKVITSIFL